MDASMDAWNQPCSNDHLLIISKHIADWTEIAPCLDLEETDEVDIKQSGNPPAQRRGMLRTWRQIHGKSATYKKLADALKIVKRQDLVDKIEELISGGWALIIIITLIIILHACRLSEFTACYSYIRSVYFTVMYSDVCFFISMHTRGA